MEEDKPEEYIDFSAKYQEWVAIKRLGILPTTKPEEIAYHLAGIRSSIDGKMFGILGINVESLDSYASEAAKSLKKGVPSMPEIALIIEKKESKAIIASACPSATLAPFAKTYLLNKLITEAGIETSLSQLALSKAFKELKPPKAPGRFGKGLKPKA